MLYEIDEEAKVGDISLKKPQLNQWSMFEDKNKKDREFSSLPPAKIQAKGEPMEVDSNEDNPYKAER